jgi:hypothetical protein
MLSVFALTVIVVRVFLNLTGYPQIGDSTFHIAHVLWGGLLLFTAVVVVLIFANHWAFWLAAALSGIGTGLFIDEVGKFITRGNDYFYPLAFPIIYSFMVVCVWLYFRVRRSDRRDTRTLFYHAFESLKDSLDNDLDLSDESELANDLHRIAEETKDTSERKLALTMLEFVKKRERIASVVPSWFDRTFARVRAFLEAYPSRRILRLLNVIGFVILGVGAIPKLVGLYSLATNSSPELRAKLSSFVIVSGKSEYVVNNIGLLLTHSFFIAAIGILAFVAAFLLTSPKERTGMRIGMLALVFALTIVNPLTFYFSQLYAIVDTFGELILIGIAQLYRWRFYLRPAGASVTPQPA